MGMTRHRRSTSRIIVNVGDLVVMTMLIGHCRRRHKQGLNPQDAEQRRQILQRCCPRIQHGQAPELHSTNNKVINKGQGSEHGVRIVNMTAKKT